MSCSGFVSRLRMACIFLRIAAEDAHDPSGGVQPVDIPGLLEVQAYRLIFNPLRRIEVLTLLSVFWQAGARLERVGWVS